MTGHLVLNADPTIPLHSTTKAYVDALSFSLDLDIKNDGTLLTSTPSSLNYSTGIEAIAAGNLVDLIVNESELTSFVRLTGNETISGVKTFVDNVIIEGDFTVTGTTTTLHTAELLVEDNVITLNSTFSGTPSSIDAGIEVERGDSTNARMFWDESEDHWAAGLAGSIQQLAFYPELVAVSGDLSTEIDTDISSYSGYAEGAFVHLTGNETVAGEKTFSDPLNVLTSVAVDATIFSVRNNTGGATLQVSSSGATVQIEDGSADNIRLRTKGSNQLLFGTNSIDRWAVSNTTGSFYPISNGVTNIGGNSNLVNAVYTESIVNNSSGGDLTIDVADDLFLTPSDHIFFKPGDADRWVMESSGKFYPAVGTGYAIGDPGSHLGNVYTTNIQTVGAVLEISGGNGIKMNWDNADRLIMDSLTIEPATAGVMNLGLAGKAWNGVSSEDFGGPSNSDLYITAENANQIVFRTGRTTGGSTSADTPHWQVGETGVFAPIANNTHDIGNTSLRVKQAYLNTVIPFTGCHMYKLKTGQVITTSDCVTLNDDKELVKTTLQNEISCGIVKETFDIASTIAELAVRDASITSLVDSTGAEYTTGTMVIVAAVGDTQAEPMSGFKVCNSGGAIVKGTLLVASSSHPGYLQAQSDSVNRAQTVGMSMESVTFVDGMAEGIYGFIYCG